MSNTLKDNLISVWCEAASAPLTDEFGSNNLTDHNTVSNGSGANTIVGTSGGFDRASSQYGSHTDNADLSLHGTDATFAAWVKIGDTTLSFQNIIGKGAWNGASDGEYLLRYTTASGRFEFFVSDGSSFDHVTANTFGALTSNVFYYVQAQHVTGSKIRIRVNGGAWDELSWTTGIRDGSDDFGVGATSGGGGLFNGYLNQVAVWKAQRSDADLNAAYASGSGLAFANWQASGGAAPIPVLQTIVLQAVKTAAYY